MIRGVIKSWPGAFLVDRTSIELVMSDGRNSFGGGENWSGYKSRSTICVEWMRSSTSGWGEKTWKDGGKFSCGVRGRVP